MIKDNRIRYFAPADYSEGGELDKLIKTIIDKTHSYEILEYAHISNNTEAIEEEKVKEKLETIAISKDYEETLKIPITETLKLSKSAIEAILQSSYAIDPDVVKRIAEVFENFKK